MTTITGEDDEKYLLTGATGFLGSHIMAGLLLQGKRLVIAGRASGTESLEGRIRKLLAWFGVEHLLGLLEYHETDLLKARMGLGEDEYGDLCSRGLSIIHCASDTSFAERDRARVLASNVESLTEIVNFARKSNSRWLHFISSAYAAGIGLSECTELPVTSTAFTNAYEESKAKAEQMISVRCREAKLPYTIIRPSIIYGDATTGKSLKFNALYYPVRSLQLIRDIYLEDIRKNGGVKAAECGIYVKDDGALHLPIRIIIPREGKINLVPVDYFTETLLSIIKSPRTETIYHITSNNPESIVRLASYTERFLHITGIEVVMGSDKCDLEETRNPPEEFFNHFIKAYRPYLSDQRSFKRENTDRAAGSALPTDLSYEVFQRCMSFAVSVDWGKNLFGPISTS